MTLFFKIGFHIFLYIISIFYAHHSFLEFIQKHNYKFHGMSSGTEVVPCHLLSAYTSERLPFEICKKFRIKNLSKVCLSVITINHKLSLHSYF